MRLSVFFLLPHKKLGAWGLSLSRLLTDSVSQVPQLWAFALSHLCESGDPVYPLWCSLMWPDSVFSMCSVTMCYTSKGTGWGPGFFSGDVQLSHIDILEGLLWAWDCVILPRSGCETLPFPACTLNISRWAELFYDWQKLLCFFLVLVCLCDDACGMHPSVLLWVWTQTLV